MNPKQPTRATGDNIPLAVAAIVVAVLGLSFGDALIKHFSVSFGLWQIFVLRSVLLTPLLVGFALWKGVSLTPESPQWGWIVLRSLMLALMWVAYYLSLPNLDLSIAAAAYYTAPIFITLIAALLTGDRIGRLGWSAVVLGFLGVFVVLRPDAGAFNAYVILPLLAAILYAGAMVLTRTKCRNDHPLLLSFALNLAFIAVGCLAIAVLWVWQPDGALMERYPLLLGSWTPMATSEWLAMGILAAAILMGSVGAAIAYQSGPAALVATFDFSYLVFAVLWGFVFFAEVPDALTVLGIAMIAGAGMLAIRR